MNIAFLLYPTHKVKVDEDSSFWIMHEMAARGHSVSYFESSHLLWKDGSPRAYLKKARLHGRKGFLFSPRPSSPTDLRAVDVIFIRKEPPFDTEYLYSLQLLSLIKNKVFVLNDPNGVAECNEKLCILSFPGFIPESLVTASADEALRFTRHLGREVVVKPLDQKGGAGIFRSKASHEDFNALLYAATLGGTSQVMVQRFLPECYSSDKRILMLDGEILGTFLRKPKKGEFRANLGLGASMHRTTLTRRERKLAETVAPWLSARGLYFAGIDSIGGLLAEINVTSPSGIPEMRQLYGTRLEKKIADFIERRGR